METTTRSRFGLSATLAGLGLCSVLLGAGCQSTASPSGEDWRPKLAAWVGTQTPVSMSDLYHKVLVSAAEQNPTTESWAQIGFAQPIPGDQVVALLEPFADVSAVELYVKYGTIGAGDVEIRDGFRGAALSAKLAQEYANNLNDFQYFIDRENKWCAEKSDWCTTGELEKYQAELGSERSRGQVYLNGIGIKGTNQSLKNLWDSTTTIFNIQIEDGPYIMGKPLYPTTNMKVWR